MDNMETFRYTAEELLHLRQSPLCVKPAGLPPASEWMGPPPENARAQAKPANERGKIGDGFLQGQENRRPGLERNGSRNTSNTEDIVLGPPRMSFASSTTARSGRAGSEAEKGTQNADRQDKADRMRFPKGDADNSFNDRFGGGKEPRNTFRRRNDQDQDSEGWSTVKPRKSFGHEGAERFTSRVGGIERYSGKEERKVRDRDDRDNDGRRRNFDHSSTDKVDEGIEGSRRNGTRGRTDPWFKDSKDDEVSPISQRERIDRAKSWRERAPEHRANDKNGERHGERRWDREQRSEREPEWLDEPAEEKAQGHTVEDFKKFMESMKKSQSGPPKPEEQHVREEAEPKLVSAPVDAGPDKFFAAFENLDASTSNMEKKEASRPRTGKSSRFMSFLAPQEESRAKAEPAAHAVPAAASMPMAPPPGLPFGMATTNSQNNEEKAAFAMLIQKLQMSSGLGQSQQTPPTKAPLQQAPMPPQPMANFHEPGRPADRKQSGSMASHEAFQPFAERRDESHMRAPHHLARDMISPRPMQSSAPPPAHHGDNGLHDLLLSQRHGTASQASSRTEQNANATMANSNKEFLMLLMQSSRNTREPQQRSPLLLQMPQPTKTVNVPNVQMPEYEGDFGRDRTSSQRQMRGQAPPGFLDDQFHAPEPSDGRQQQPPPQPTQILQRPPNLGNLGGLEHGMHPFLSNQMGAPQRPMIPPPGLVNGPRNLAQPMFPPNYQQQQQQQQQLLLQQQLQQQQQQQQPGFPPPDNLVGPPRSMPPPPPGFFGGPPPGFMPLHGMGGFQGPDGSGFPGGPSPFDRRGMLPPGAGAFRGP